MITTSLYLNSIVLASADSRHKTLVGFGTYETIEEGRLYKYSSVEDHSSQIILKRSFIGAVASQSSNRTPTLEGLRGNGLEEILIPATAIKNEVEISTSKPLGSSPKILSTKKERKAP